MNVRELPVWEKPREKLLREGGAKLSTAEIMALLLRTGTRDKSALDLAGEILSMDPSGVRFLASCTPEELKKIKGMGDAKTCELLAAVELGRRIARSQPVKSGRIRGSADAADLFMERLRHERKEHFFCLLLNSKGEIIEETEVSIGDLCSSDAGPREVYYSAVRRSAASVIFLHNHPSGDPTPSAADLKTTRRLEEAGRLLGIPVLDHLIIGDGRYISMKAEGMF